MANEQVNSESLSAVRELSAMEMDIVSGGRLGIPDPILPPSPTFPPVVI